MESNKSQKKFIGKIFINIINLVLSSLFMDLLLSFNKNILIPLFFPKLKKLVIKNKKCKIYLGKFLESIIRASVIVLIIYVININLKNS